jgi:hypothetical protein
MPDTTAAGAAVPAPARRLVAKLAAIMKQVGRVPKRGHNKHFDYRFATEVDVSAALQTRLADAGIMVIPGITGHRREGKLTAIDMTFTFIDSESGEEIVTPWAGHGEDSSDKGMPKAITGALKYFLLKTFLVPTGDDPEASDAEGRRTSRPAQRSRGNEPPPDDPRPGADPSDARKITPEMLQRLRSTMALHEVNEPAFGRWMREAFGYTKWGDIQRKDYDAIVARAQSGPAEGSQVTADDIPFGGRRR